MAADPSIGERSHVLVLGARGGAGCPERLVRRLIDRALSEEEGGPADAPFHWTLITKYYRAELSLHVRHADPGTTPTSEALDVGEEPHGVILMVDGPKPAAEGEAGLEPWRPWCVPTRLIPWGYSTVSLTARASLTNAMIRRQARGRGGAGPGAVPLRGGGARGGRRYGLGGRGPGGAGARADAVVSPVCQL